MEKQKGFTIAEILIVVLLVSLIGLAVFQALKLRSAAETKAVAKSTPVAVSHVYARTADISCDTAAHYSIKSGEADPVVASTTSTPSGDMAAILRISPKCGAALVETRLLNIKYSFCSTLALYDASGEPASIDDFNIGTYAHLTYSGSCISSMQLDLADSSCGSGYGGYADVFLEAYNAAAHSVIYQPAGARELYAEKLCGQAVVVDADKNAIEMNKIKPGSPVKLMLTSGSFISTVQELKSIR